MKQNIKFIWIYGAILFSFALILILFAGLTQKESAHQEEKLSKSLSSLAKENWALTSERDELSAKNKELEKTAEELTVQRDSLSLEKEALITAIDGDREITAQLLDAYSQKMQGKSDLAIATVQNLNKNAMSKTQINLYNMIIGE